MADASQNWPAPLTLAPKAGIGDILVRLLEETNDAPLSGQLRFRPPNPA
ncbi:MAG: hypothetical protein U1C59_00085 [Methylotenera sp.]|nr:hypothetical protein [Methylotenera sp.]